MKKNSKFLDAMAQRYHCLPSDILNLSIVDYQINVAVMINSESEVEENKGCKCKVVDNGELDRLFKEKLKKFKSVGK